MTTKEVWSHVFLQKLPQDNQNKAKSTPALRVKLSWRARFQTPTQLKNEPTREESSIASKSYNGGVRWLFGFALHNPAETSATGLGAGNAFVIEALSVTHTPNDTDVFSVARVCLTTSRSPY